MITKVKPVGNARAEFYGLSTDEKPTEGVANASVFYEMDTTNVFMFDAENNVWHEQ